MARRVASSSANSYLRRAAEVTAVVPSELDMLGTVGRELEARLRMELGRGLRASMADTLPTLHTSASNVFAKAARYYYDQLCMRRAARMHIFSVVQ